MIPRCPIRTCFCDEVRKATDIIYGIHKFDCNADIFTRNDYVSFAIWSAILRNVRTISEEFIDDLSHLNLLMAKFTGSNEDIKGIRRTIAIKDSSGKTSNDSEFDF